MIIDFHTHTFPDKIAPKAIASLSKTSNMCSFLDGTYNQLLDSKEKAGVDICVVLPVATSASQCTSINDTAYRTNENYDKTGILSFGGLHPDCDNYKEIINDLCDHNIKGIKLHPVFQGVYFDDIKYLRILDYAFSRDLCVVTHAGYDISFPGNDLISVEHIVKVLDQMDCSKLVLAHMGGYGEWDKVYEQILGRDVYIDTAFSCIEPNYKSPTKQDIPCDMPISEKMFTDMVEKHGSHKVVFGTDSPWDDQTRCIAYIKKTDLTDNEKENILSVNAKRLLSV